VAAAKPKKGDRYVVLNHGDLWTNNFMYAYENASQPEVPTSAIFLDFQLSFFGSPACDLNFFLNTSLKLELLQERRQDLVRLYYQAFRDDLDWGSNPGDNYCSAIYRVELTFTKWIDGEENAGVEQLSLIVKVIPISKATQLLQDAGVFIKEKQTYTDVLPRLEILSNGDAFGPR